MVGVGEKGNTRRVFADIVSADYFAVLGVAPMQGRVFLPEEETPGRDAPVAMVSYSYWTRHNRVPSILGSQIQINGRSFTVIGILPQTFTGTMTVFSPEVWVPLSAYDSIANNFATEKNKPLASREGEHLMLIARLKPGHERDRSGTGAKNIGRKSGASVSGRTKRSDVYDTAGLALFHQRRPTR